MRIAIVGTGVSGLVAAYLLQREHEIEVFEANDRLGGHTHTVYVGPQGGGYDVDTGFIVFNERTYPNFCRLLEELGVESQASEMSFSFSCERTGLEYSGSGLNGLFAQRRNLLRPSFLRMVRDVFRFYGEAGSLLAEDDPKLTLGSWLDARGFSSEFVTQHLLPMGAAIWSATPQQMRDFPAHTFARFFENHGLLQLRDRPAWRVVKGGSCRYLEALTADFQDRIHLACPVRGIRRSRRGVDLLTEGGREEAFDHVVIATHSDQALSILADPSPAERQVLGAIRYQPNLAVLHTDTRLLPRQRRAWASWNYHRLRHDPDHVAVTYAMNRLQGFESRREFLVTLNRPDAIHPRYVIGRYLYHHPVFDAGALEAQQHRDSVSGRRRTHYCGAYWGHGFHEDGVNSALAVARWFGLHF